MEMKLEVVLVPVSDVDRAKAFYEKLLAPLEIRIVAEFGVYTGFGLHSRAFFWIGGRAPDFWTAAHKPGASPTHVAFDAKDRAQGSSGGKACLEVVQSGGSTEPPTRSFARSCGAPRRNERCRNGCASPPSG